MKAIRLGNFEEISLEQIGKSRVYEPDRDNIKNPACKSSSRDAYQAKKIQQILFRTHMDRQYRQK